MVTIKEMQRVFLLCISQPLAQWQSWRCHRDAASTDTRQAEWRWNYV